MVNLRWNLNSYGWNARTTGENLDCIDQDLGNVIRAFNFHFYPQKPNWYGDWDENSQLILEDILIQAGEVPV